MLSLLLRRCFAAIGVRMLLRAEPKNTAAQLKLGTDLRGWCVGLSVPRLSRKTVEVLALEPRRKRLVLRLTQDDEAAYFIVQGGCWTRSK